MSGTVGLPSPCSGAIARPATLASVDPARDPRWLELIAARGGGIFHSPPWIESLADAYGFRIEANVLTDADGRAVAGMAFCRIADVVGERVVSLPFSDYCDPLVASRDEWARLFQGIASFGLPVLFRCLDDRNALADERLHVVKRARWHGIDVDADPATLRARIANPARRSIRKAEREGVTVSVRAGEELLDEFSALHVALRKRKYRMLAQPRTFFDALRARFARTDGWYPLAARHGGRTVAVTIYLRWGDTLYYKFNASAPEASALRPNDALLWEGIRLARELGCRRLDLGASDDDQPGLIRFKRHYGAAEREITFLRYTPARTDDAAQADALAMLARLTALLTDPAVPDEVAARAGADLYRFFA